MSYLARRRWRCPSCDYVTSTPSWVLSVACGCQAFTSATIARMTEVTGPADRAEGIELRIVADNGRTII